MSSYVITVHERLVSKFLIEANSPKEALYIYEDTPASDLPTPDTECLDNHVEGVRDAETEEDFDVDDLRDQLSADDSPQDPNPESP